MDKRATVYVIDGSSLMALCQNSDQTSSILNEVITTIKDELATLVLWGRKSDQAGVIFWDGSAKVLHNIQAPTKESIENAFVSIQASQYPVNVIDGAQEALDLIIRHTRKLKFVRTVKVYAIGESIASIYDERKVFKLKETADSCGAFVDFYIHKLDDRFPLPQDLFQIEQFKPIDELHHISKPIKPVVSFKGLLTLGHPDSVNVLEAEIALYPATRRARPATASKYYGEQHESISTMAESIVDDVPTEEIEKGYVYGSEIIPVPDDLAQILKRTPLTVTDSFEILGFLPSTAPWSFIESSDFVVPTTDRSSMLIASLARSLYERQQGALARFSSAKRSEVIMLYLEPYITNEHQWLLTKVLPFDQDVRDIQLFDFAKLGEDYIPSSEMESLTEIIMDKMCEDQVAYPLEELEVFNPQIMRIESFIKRSALNNDSIVPRPTDITMPGSNKTDLEESFAALGKLLDIQSIVRTREEKSAQEESYLATETHLDLDEIFG